MSKKMKILCAVIAAVVLIAIGGTVAVLAEDPTPTPTPTPTTTPVVKVNIEARVADILGITQAQLTDAIKQARVALSSAPVPTPPATATKPFKPAFSQADLYAKMAEILNNTAITADTIAAAYQQAEKEAANLAVTNALDKAVQNGKISPDEESQIQTWLQNRPAAVDKLMPNLPGLGSLGPMGPGMGMGPGLRGKAGLGGRMGPGNCFRNFPNQGANPQIKVPAPSLPTQ